MGSTTLKVATLLTGLILGSSAIAADSDDMASGAMLAGTCFACHGPDGVSTGPSIPTIGGLPEEFLVDKMMAYKEDRHYGTIMQRIMKGYSKDEIESMSRYISRQRYEVVTQKVDTQKAAMGEKLHKKSCEKCHEDGGRSGEEAGILSGQWFPYLVYTMEDYRTGRSEMPRKMKRRVDKLDDAEIDALMHYYAGQSK